MTEAEEIVRRFGTTIASGDFEAYSGMLSENFLIRLSTGRLYTGRGALERLHADQVISYEGWDLSKLRFSDRGDGFVLVSGEADATERDGSTTSKSGGWLFYLRDGKVQAVVHYPTERAALAALPGSLRRIAPSELVERVISVFNRGDLAPLLGLVSSDYRLVRPGEDPVEGIASIIAFGIELQERFDDFLIEDYELEQLSETAVFFSGGFRMDQGGSTERTRTAAVVTLEGGLLYEWHVVDDREQALAELERRRGD